MALHLVLSRGETAERPGRLTLAEGQAVEHLLTVSSTDDPEEFCAVLRVLLDGGTASHPRIERDWGQQLRELHAIVAAARGQGDIERQTGPLEQRLRGGVDAD